MCKDMTPLELAIQFHGHICPGLLMGVRASQLAMQHLDLKRDQDEDVVAIVETDSCGVDALQAILGCTFGKGNLIFKDYGKAVYTVINRQDGRAVRIVQRRSASSGKTGQRYRELKGREDLNPAEKEEMEQVLQELFEQLMTCPYEELFDWQDVDVKLPPKASLYSTLTCSNCQEGVMETRAVETADGVLCIPCFDLQRR
ncbi:MAG TPA: formylmethanofuran dehydrogenase [Syntrophomonas sp.]|nr:formylmethanofuran dehydrogenase [Syntrophomonas sp.]